MTKETIDEFNRPHGMSGSQVGREEGLRNKVNGVTDTPLLRYSGGVSSGLSHFCLISATLNFMSGSGTDRFDTRERLKCDYILKEHVGEIEGWIKKR